MINYTSETDKCVFLEDRNPKQHHQMLLIFFFFFNLDSPLDSGSFSAELLEMTCYFTYSLKNQSDNLCPIEM